MGGFFGCCNTSTTSSASGGIGASLAFASPSGVIDPNVTGFNSTTGRLKITLTGNTSWEGLPAATDGQQLFGTIVAGNFQLTLLHSNGATAQAQILAAADYLYSLGDTFQLFFDGGLSEWVLVA